MLLTKSKHHSGSRRSFCALPRSRNWGPLKNESVRGFMRVVFKGEPIQVHPDWDKIQLVFCLSGRTDQRKGDSPKFTIPEGHNQFRGSPILGVPPHPPNFGLTHVCRHQDRRSPKPFLVSLQTKMERIPSLKTETPGYHLQLSTTKVD